MNTNIEYNTITDRNFYSNIIEALEYSQEMYSQDEDELIVNINNFKFDRFVCITGETNPKECRLMIDTQTGYLYSPKWFNESKQEFYEEECEHFLTHLSIYDLSNWKILGIESFQDIALEERQKWFDAKNVFAQQRDRIVLTQNTSNNSWYVSGSALPFIYHDVYVSQEIWDQNFTNLKFARFLRDNGFKLSKVEFQHFLLPQESYPLYKSVPTILKELEEKTGIALHKEQIVFPYQLFHNVSQLSKYQNAIAYIDFLLSKIEFYANDHSDKLQMSIKVYQSLSSLKTSNQYLSDVRDYLLKQFNFSFHNLENRLKKFKIELNEVIEVMEADALEFFDDTNASLFDFSLKTQNFDFNLFGEMATHIYNSEVQRITNLSQEIDSFEEFIKPIIDEIFTLSLEFQNNKKEQLKQYCENEYVEDAFEAIFQEWNYYINEIEKQYLPLLQTYFHHKVSVDNLMELSELLNEYRLDIDTFFLNERIGLIHKYHNNPKSQFLQKIETEHKILSYLLQLRQKIKDLIDIEETLSNKKILNVQSQALIETQLTNLTKFSQEINIASDIQSQLYELQKQNFEIFLSDVTQYGEELENQNRALNSLLFKMEKDIEKSENIKSLVYQK